MRVPCHDRLARIRLPMAPAQESNETYADLRVLSDEEAQLLQAVLALLRTDFSEEAALVERRFADLQGLGAAISRFPTVMDSRLVRGARWDRHTLAASLLDLSQTKRLLYTPTRIVAARGFLVAKIHAFSLLTLLSCDLGAFVQPIRQVVFSVVCSLMAEDVYLACLSNPGIPQQKKELLAEDLVRLWDSGHDPRASDHVPALQALWRVRESAPPVFGTMDGSSELIRLSLDLDEVWQEFIFSGLGDEETRGALEEFVFGLSSEEIREVRSRLAKYGIGAIDRDEVRAYLGTDPAYSPVDGADVRSIYTFFTERREAALGRLHSQIPGPRRSLEELYLMHRMVREA